MLLDALVQASSAVAATPARLEKIGRLAALLSQLEPGGGEAALAAYRLELFRPVQPMLADSAETVAEALAELGDATIEWKLDGARIQVHAVGDRVAVYTRNLNDVTARVPEVVDAVRALG